MKVRLKDITARGLNLNAAMNLSSLNNRMNEGKGGSKGFVFLEAPIVNLLIHKSSQGGIAQGIITGRYKQSCSLCLEEVERDLDLNVKFLLREKPENISENDERYQDDVGLFHFSGDQVDLEKILEEMLLLSLTIYWHPPLDENSSCSVCKRIFSQKKGDEKVATQTFADLLKKAGMRSFGNS